MAAGFDFTSPGAAFADSLTDSLVKNKMMQRQQLLDTLGVQAQDRANQEADEMKKYREYEMSMGRERDERERMDYMTRNMEPGADPEKQGWSADDLAMGRKYGLFNQTQQMVSPPTMGADTGTGSTAAQGPQFKTAYSYIGTPAQQELQKRKVSTQQLIDSEQDPAKKHFLQTDAAMNGGMLSEHALKATEPNIPILIDVDPITHRQTATTLDGKPVTLGPHGETPFGTVPMIKPPRIPNPPHEHYMPAGVDGNGHVIMFDTDKREFVTSPGTAVPLAKQGNQHPVTFKEGLEKPYGAAAMALRNAPSKLNADAAWQTAMDLVQGATNATQNARSLFHQTLIDPQGAIGHLNKIKTDPNHLGFSQQDIDQYIYLKDNFWPDDLSNSYWNEQQKAKQGWGSWFMNGIFGMPQETPQ